MPGYTIIAQPLITFHDPATNRVVEGREVDFRDNDSGDHGRIRVATAGYTPDNVNALIEAELARMAAVRSLSTPPTGP